MSVQYLHMEKVGGVAASLQDHYDGATRAATAEARGGLAPVVDLLAGALPPPWAQRPQGAAAVSAALTIFRTAPRGRGAPVQKPVLDFIVAGPPHYEGVDGTPGWPVAHVQAWARDVLAWVAAAAPASTAMAWLHQDEIAPHIHLCLVATDGASPRPRYGWPAVQQGFAGGVDCGRNWRGYYRQLLDHFHATVGDKYGLARDRGLGRLPRLARIDRQDGERKRAFAGGYSRTYLARAPPRSTALC